ncbi:hypothetical protein BDF14DRAFT_1748775 [Spinellus fusiger]|nr:hypothetical protein BDF14DRAFT_1748775 [Spinellus fusiger]
MTGYFNRSFNKINKQRTLLLLLVKKSSCQLSEILITCFSALFVFYFSYFHPTSACKDNG